MRDAIDQTEKLIDQIGKNPNDAKAWTELEIYVERIKSRGITLTTVIRNLIKSQKAG